MTKEHTTSKNSEEKQGIAGMFRLSDIEIKKMYFQAVSYQLKDPSILESKVRLANPNVDPEEYLRKLNDYRKGLEKEIKEREKALGGKHPLPQIRPHTGIGIPGIRIDPRIEDILGSIAIVIGAPHEPSSLTGYVTPYEVICRTEDEKSINHGSSYDHRCLKSWELTQSAMELEDDDAWWRRDNPDWFWVSHIYRWELPEAPWDAQADIGIFIAPIVSFRNDANKYGRVLVNLVFGHSDSQGDFPAEAKIPFNDHYKENEWGYSKRLLDKTTTDWYEIEQEYEFIRFRVEEGCRGRVELALLYWLIAQDGTVKAFCYSILHELLMGNGITSSLSRSPRLAYYMKKEE